jgi:hypothetical protein
MFLRDLYTSAKRRWYFVVAGLLVTAALASGFYQMAPVKYEATASVALIPPPTAVISGDNPFLYMGGLEQALGVLIVKINSDAVREPLENIDADSSYFAARDATTSGPIVTVSSEGPTQEAALAMLNRVLGATPAALSSLQDELALPQTARITLLKLAADREATLAAEGRTRGVLVVLAVGLASTFLLTGLMDKVLIRRKSNEEARGSGKRVRRSADELERSNQGETSSTDELPDMQRLPVTVPDTRA